MKGPYVIFCGGHSTLLHSKHYSQWHSQYTEWQMGEDSVFYLSIYYFFFVRIIRGQRPSSSKQMLRSTREIRARSSRDSGPEKKKNDTNQSDLRPSIKANISWIVLEARQAVNIWTLNTPFPLSSLIPLRT